MVKTWTIKGMACSSKSCGTQCLTVAVDSVYASPCSAVDSLTKVKTQPALEVDCSRLQQQS